MPNPKVVVADAILQGSSPWSNATLGFSRDMEASWMLSLPNTRRLALLNVFNLKNETEMERDLLQVQENPI